MSETITEVRGYRRRHPTGQPPYLHPAYVASRKRAPAQPLILLPHTLTEVTGPLFGHGDVRETDNDLTIQHGGVPLGQRINVSGRLLDEDGRPVRGALIEIWQANAAGRYLHKADTFPGPIDANFSGAGRMLTDSEGRYRFVTVKPGAYPWPNGANTWRPAHIHFSIFGAGLLTRLITQMYFPGDPLLPFDAIFNGVPDERARNLLISRLDWDTTEPNHALGYRFDVVLRGRDATPMEA